MYDYDLKFFEQIYCINIPETQYRWKRIEDEFRRTGVLDRIKRVWAKPPSKDFLASNYRYPQGEFGVCLSQMKAIVQGIESGARSILIFEDDIAFVADPEKRLVPALNSLSVDWRVLYLGGRPKSKVKQVGDCLVKVGTFTSAMSYAVSGSAMLTYFELFLDRLSRPFPGACCDNIFGGAGL